MLQPYDEREVISMPPVPLPLLSQEEDQCHCRGWHVTGASRYHPELGREVGVPQTASAVMLHLSSWDVTENRRRWQGRAPTRDKCGVKNYLSLSLCLSPPVYNRDTHKTPSLTPSAHKNEPLNLPLTHFIHSFIHYS